MNTFYFGHGKADAGLDQKSEIGGKGASLAEITRAGLPTPPGFTISVGCCKTFLENEQWPQALDAEIRDRIRQLEQATGKQFDGGSDSLLVAVRSGAAESMPGMMDTILNVGKGPDDPYAQLTNAIQAVFRSWNSERAVAYRRRHDLQHLMGTSVTVQAMCPAEVAGVLFTADPMAPESGNMVVEAVRGLGEALVSGKVTPQRYIWNVAEKRTVDRQESDDLLSDQQLAELAELGRRVEEHFQAPCDIEWAAADGAFMLLQARPIKGLDAAVAVNSDERDLIRREEIETLRGLAEPDGTVWVRNSMAEILPTPTPMTWSIVREFVSGKGGYGLMYADLGFQPDSSLDDDGVYDLICGRPYCNLSREPKMQFRNLPFEHPFSLLKKNPQQAANSQAVFVPGKASWRFFVFFPIICFKLIRGGMRLKSASRTFADRFRSEIVPKFMADVEAAREQDWSQKDPGELWDALQSWIKRTLIEFARESLKPTVFAEIASGNLTRGLAQRLAATSSEERSQADRFREAQAMVRELVIGVKPEEGTDLAQGIADVANGACDVAEFAKRFGHRGREEMELSQPRWREDAAALQQLLSAANPVAAMHDESEKRWEATAKKLDLSGTQSAILRNEWQRLRANLALRETAKHYFMMGYDVLRRILLALGKHLELNDRIFYLTKDDLAELIREPAKRDAMLERAAANQRRRDAALSLYVPPVLFSDDLDVIGLDPKPDDATNWQGTPLSTGVAVAPAWVVVNPDGAIPPAEAYILVCPTTDPAWLPLFLQAKGLVMETGGMLSHGAIVAREFGLPAVAGLPNVHKSVKTGQMLRVDGGAGAVNVLS